MDSEAGSTVIELIISLTIIVMIGSAVFLSFQASNDGLVAGMQRMRTSFRTFALDEAYRTVVRETRIAYWEKSGMRIEEIEDRLRAIPRSGRDIRVNPIVSQAGIPVGVAIRYEVEGRECETVETFSSWGVFEPR